MLKNQGIEHEIVAKRYWIERNEVAEDIQELKSCTTAIPLCNVLDWEEVLDFHENIHEELTAVMLPYDTKFINIPFRVFHKTMKQYRENGREERKWSRFN